MGRPATGTATRITASFDKETAEAIRGWGQFHGAESQSEALRLLVAYALAKGTNPALAMAYQQTRANLTEFIQAGVVSIFEALRREYERRRGT